jgi:NhaC family Na+:H+ antiporter
VLVPWNTCGAYISGVLGVSTASYFPYCIFNIVSPILDVAYGFLGFKVPQRSAEPEPPPAGSPPTPPSPGEGSVSPRH